jgi:hypothetical protein
MWICRICGERWETIADDATELSHSSYRRHSYLYRFADGTIHDLHKIKSKPSEVTVQPEPPVEQTGLLQTVVSVLESLPVPEPQSEIIMDPKIEDESDSESVTTMGAAFKRISR